MDSHRDSITPKMPALFIGHGTPMNAIDTNQFSRTWKSLGRTLPKPRAILCISAHWETHGTRVTIMKYPETLHDFSDFPLELYQKRYPAPGAPEFAEITRKLIHKTHVEPNLEWGLDHGAWSVLCQMYPWADIPVFELSLDRSKPPRYHYELGRELAPLRDQGVLIIGSGNMVHNLNAIESAGQIHNWASDFDETLKEMILKHNHDALIRYEHLGPEVHLAIPSNEHYLPLLYILALQGQNEPLQFFNEAITHGSISMRSLQIG